MAKKVKGRSVECAQAGRDVARDAYPLDTLRVNSDENALKWVFHRTPDATWRWRKTSQARGIIAESSACYPNYAECLSDAEAHGYKQWLVASQLTPLSFPYATPAASSVDGPNTAPAASSAVNVLTLIPFRGDGAH